MNSFRKKIRGAIISTQILDREGYKRLLANGDVKMSDLAGPSTPLPERRLRGVSDYLDPYGFLLTYPEPIHDCFGSPRFRADGTKNCASCPLLSLCSEVVDRRLDFTARNIFDALILNPSNKQLAIDLSNIAYWFDWILKDKKVLQRSKDAVSWAKRAKAQSDRLKRLNDTNLELRELDKIEHRNALFASFEAVEAEYDLHSVFNRLMDLQSSPDTDSGLRRRLSDLNSLHVIAIASTAVQQLHGPDYGLHVRDTCTLASKHLSLEKAESLRRLVRKHIETAELLKSMDVLPS